MEVTPGGGREGGRDEVGRRVGHYVVESKIGRGGMGEVYLARDELLPRHVALKRMALELRGDPEYRHRFREEAEKAIRISDRRIASLLDVVEVQDEIFLVLEYVPGPSLRQRLSRPIDLPDFLPLAVECTEALAAAHRSGIVHRDVKPENYVIGPRGAVKLLDLGVAKSVPRTDDDSTQPLDPQSTQPTLIGGTPAYMAPEALLGLRSDFRSDIFSLGVMFYEMLSGSHPFHAATQPATQDRILHEEPAGLATIIPSIPLKLDRLVTRMITKDAGQRPATAHDVLHDLLEIERHKEEIVAEVKVTPPGRRQALVDWLRRHSGSILGLGALAIAIASALIVPEPPILPDDLRVRILTFTSPRGTQDSRLTAAGLSGTLEQTLRRLTDPKVLDVVPRTGRLYRPIQTVTRDPDRPRTNLELTGHISEKSGDIEVRLDLRSREGSSPLRSASVEAPSNKPLMLVDRTLVAAVGLLQLDIQPEELALVWRPSTSDDTAFGYELRARGYLLEAGALQDPQDSTPWKVAWRRNQESAQDSLRICADLDSAEAAYARACAVDSMDADAWYGRAFARWKRHEGPSRVTDHAEVPAWCQRALQIDLDHPASHALLGEYYAAAQRDPAAVAELNRAVALNPTDYFSVRKLVQLYRQQNRWDYVESTYRRQIDRFPDSHYWYSWLGTYFFRKAKYDSAAVYFRKSLDREPDEDRTQASMGVTCLMQGRYDSAIPYLRTAIARRPSALRYSNLGTVLFVTRRLAAAESAYAKAVALDPNHYMFWGNLGDSRYWNPSARARAPEAYHQAIALAGEALTKAPNDRVIRVRLAHYLSKTGELAACHAELRRALAGKVDHGEVLYTAALVFHQLAETDSAFVYLQRALDSGYSPLWVRDTPELDDLRSDPRFARLRTMQSEAY